MKKGNMLLIALIISLIAKGQFSLQPRVGLNENKHAIAAMDIAYRTHGAEAALIINDVQNVREPAFFGYRLSYAIPVTHDLNVMPIVGRSFRYMSNDKRIENYWVWNIGLRVEKDVVFLQADYVKQFQVTIGVIVR